MGLNLFSIDAHGIHHYPICASLTDMNGMAVAFAHRVDISQSVHIAHMTYTSMTPGSESDIPHCTDANFDPEFSCDTPYGKTI